MQIRPDNEVTVMVVTAESSLCYENAEGLLESARDALSRNPENLTLDLGEVEMIDSSGLRVLLQIRKSCAETGAELKLGSVSDCVARIISMSRLGPVFGLDDLRWDTRPAAPSPRIDLEGAQWKTYEYAAVSDAFIIAGLRERAVEAAIEAGAAGELLCDIRIAVGEALTNAYKHGSPNKGVDQIQLRCMTCPGAVVVEIQDEGAPFNPDGVREHDPSKMRDHGMGIFLMREAMDLVEFQHNCPGNRVRMVKWLRPGG
jgi:anti-anti-sigma factor